MAEVEPEPLWLVHHKHVAEVVDALVERPYHRHELRRHLHASRRDLDSALRALQLAAPFAAAAARARGTMR